MFNRVTGHQRCCYQLAIIMNLFMDSVFYLIQGICASFLNKFVFHNTFVVLSFMILLSLFIYLENKKGEKYYLLKRHEERGSKYWISLVFKGFKFAWSCNQGMV